MLCGKPDTICAHKFLMNAPIFVVGLLVFIISWPQSLRFFVIFYGFLSDPGVPGVRSMGPDVRPSIHPRLFAELTDVTLADEDSNSIPTNDVNRAILGNLAMQVAPLGGQN